MRLKKHPYLVLLFTAKSNATGIIRIAITESSLIRLNQNQSSFIDYRQLYMCIN